MNQWLHNAKAVSSRSTLLVLYISSFGTNPSEQQYTLVEHWKVIEARTFFRNTCICRARRPLPASLNHPKVPRQNHKKQVSNEEHISHSLILWTWRTPSTNFQSFADLPQPTRRAWMLQLILGSLSPHLLMPREWPCFTLENFLTRPLFIWASLLRINSVWEAAHLNCHASRNRNLPQRQGLSKVNH